MADPLTTGLIVAGTVMEAGAEQELGFARASRGKVQKALNEVAATQVVAIGQRKAFGEKKQAELMASRAIAVSAAGGSPDDIDNLIADIDSAGIYNASIQMYEAETEAERLKFEGLMAEQTGKEEMEAGQLRAFSTVLSGAGSLASMGKPGKTGKTAINRPKPKPGWINA